MAIELTRALKAFNPVTKFEENRLTFVTVILEKRRVTDRQTGRHTVIRYIVGLFVSIHCGACDVCTPLHCGKHIYRTVIRYTVDMFVQHYGDNTLSDTVHMYNIQQYTYIIC